MYKENIRVLTSDLAANLHETFLRLLIKNYDILKSGKQYVVLGRKSSILTFYNKNIITFSFNYFIFS